MKTPLIATCTLIAAFTPSFAQEPAKPAAPGQVTENTASASQGTAPQSGTSVAGLGDLDTLFTKIDSDNDGKLTRQEFLKIAALMPGTQPGGTGNRTSIGNPGSTPTNAESKGSNAGADPKKK